MSLQPVQLDLFDHVASVFARAGNGIVDNAALYERTAKLASIDVGDLEQRSSVGKARQKHSLVKRKIRWHQQSLKQMGLIERVDRGTWKLTAYGKKKLQLHEVETRVAMLGYSTDLGVCIWGAAERVFERLDRPITVALTSPPYPLKKPRAYGNPKMEREYVDFICRTLEPIVAHLAPGASLCLNISNDIFEPGLPSRSIYVERLVVAIYDRLGLHLMDRIPWINPSKPPGPVQWASIERFQLNMTWEPILWFTNDPMRVRSDNRRVLQEHTEKHLKLLKEGGEKRDGEFCDGAYTLRAGKSFSSVTEGKIPRNVLTVSHTCANKRETARRARELGLPVHGATFPLAMARFLVDFLTGDGDDELVADFMSGWNTTGLAAEMKGVPWISSEIMYEYVRGGAERFVDMPGYCLNPNFRI